jgi:hypothetical protein
VPLSLSFISIEHNANELMYSELRDIISDLLQILAPVETKANATKALLGESSYSTLTLTH